MSLLFGQRGRKGASANRGGLMQADRGTLYLTNVEHLGESLSGRLVELGQPKASRERRRGSGAPDVRLIVAASRALEDPTGQTGAWANLQMNVAGSPLFLPPLRERVADIPLLVEHAVNVSHADIRPRGNIRFAPDALERLAQHPWPGNVRQLFQTVLHLILTTKGSLIDIEMVNRTLDAESSPARSDEPTIHTPVRTLQDLEREEIRRALLVTNGNKAEAARLLGIHRNTLGLKLNALEKAE